MPDMFSDDVLAPMPNDYNDTSTEIFPSPESMLDQLAAMRNAIEALKAERSQIAFDIIPAILRQQVADAEVEYNDKIKAGVENIAALESAIKTACIARGESIKGKILRVIYSRGKDSWDEKGLWRYAKEHPEILEFYKPGNPYCQGIREIKAGKAEQELSNDIR